MAKHASKSTKVLFVCLGNICRSPTAEAVFRKLVEDQGLSETIECQSAGTGGWHVGEPSDRRMIAHAKRRDYLLDGRGMQISTKDFEIYDHIITMDPSNFDDVKAIAPQGSRAKITPMVKYSSSTVREVPDPYYGGEAGFEKVLDILEDACSGLLNEIK